MKIKTTSLVASLVAIGVAVSALVCVQPVFAQSDGGFAGPGISTDGNGLPWGSGPALAPAPMGPATPQTAPMLGGFMPEPPRALNEPSADPAIPATSPLLTVPPDSMARPGGGLYSPVR
jgi:hypothetical protein